MQAPALDNPVLPLHISLCHLMSDFPTPKSWKTPYFLQTKLAYLARHSQIPTISPITYFFSPFSSKSVWSTIFFIHQWSHMKFLHSAFAHVVLPTWNAFPYFLLYKLNLAILSSSHFISAMKQSCWFPRTCPSSNCPRQHFNSPALSCLWHVPIYTACSEGQSHSVLLSCCFF